MSAPRPRGDGIPGPATPSQTSSPAGPGTTNSAPAAEAEAAAGAESSREAAFAQALDVAVRERDRALDKATSRLASVTAGGYLEYDRSVSVALAAFESAWHNARSALAVAGNG